MMRRLFDDLVQGAFEGTWNEEVRSPDLLSRTRHVQTRLDSVLLTQAGLPGVACTYVSCNGTVRRVHTGSLQNIATQPYMGVQEAGTPFSLSHEFDTSNSTLWQNLA